MNRSFTPIASFLLFYSLFLIPITHGATINVPKDYPSIQQAMDVALNGDTVLVAPGTYVENINFKGKAIIVKSSGGAGLTTIDGGSPVNPEIGSTVTFENNEGKDSVLEGFKITNGTGTYFKYAPGYWGFCGGGLFINLSSPTITGNEVSGNSVNYYGGGVFCTFYSAPVLHNNTISKNAAYGGGGICFFDHASPSMTNSTVSENAADVGGGICCKVSSPTLTNITISKNTGNSGGGICCYSSSPTITDSKIIGNSVSNYGGGICCYDGSSPAIINAMITNNFADKRGGGMLCNGYSSPAIMNTTILKNATNYEGGGICCYYFSSPTIKNSKILENIASHQGGGIHCYHYSSPTITNITIQGNSADWGGGISFLDLCKSTISNAFIAGNSADYGGGISCREKSYPSITNSNITGNTAHIEGGGVLCHSYSPLNITNTMISENTAKESGGGIFCNYSSPGIMNTTIAQNTANLRGGGIGCIASSPKLKNNILWDNTASVGPEIWLGASTHPSKPSISYSDIEGGLSSVFAGPDCKLHYGPGMIDADPLFVDPINEDFHLTFISPCRGSGDNKGVKEPMDFEGDPRIVQGVVDMGADEFHTRLYQTGDPTPGGYIEIKFVDLPGTSPVVLWVGSGVLKNPIPTIYGDWFLESPILLTLGLGSIASPKGVSILPFVINPAFPAMDIPMQAGIGVKLTNLYELRIE